MGWGANGIIIIVQRAAAGERAPTTKPKAADNIMHAGPAPAKVRKHALDSLHGGVAGEPAAKHAKQDLVAASAAAIMPAVQCARGAGGAIAIATAPCTSCDSCGSAPMGALSGGAELHACRRAAPGSAHAKQLLCAACIVGKDPCRMHDSCVCGIGCTICVEAYGKSCELVDERGMPCEDRWVSNYSN